MPRLRYFDTVDLLALTATGATKPRSAVKCTANRSFIARIRRVLGTKSHQNILNNRRVAGSGIISDSSANNSDREFDEEDEDDLFQYLDSGNNKNYNRGGAGMGPVATALAAERNSLNTSQIRNTVQQQQQTYQQSMSHQSAPAAPTAPSTGKSSTLQPFPGNNYGPGPGAATSKPFQSSTHPPASTFSPRGAGNANSSSSSAPAYTNPVPFNTSSKTTVPGRAQGVVGGVNKKKLYENLHATHTATSVQKRRSQIATKMVDLIPDWNHNRAQAAAAAAQAHTPRFVPSG